MKFSLFGRDDLLSKFIYGLAVVMFTAVIFIYFGARNTSEFSLKTIAILTCALSVAAALSYLIALIIFRRVLAAFVFNIICWSAFYLLSFFMQFTATWWPFKHGITLFVTIIIFVVALLSALLVCATGGGGIKNPSSQFICSLEF